MPISLPDNIAHDIRQPILGDSFRWEGVEAAAAKKLEQSNSVMLMEGMVSAVTRQTKRYQVTGVVIRRDIFFKAAFNARMITMVYDQILGSSTKLTFKLISFKNSLFIAFKPTLLSTSISNHLQMFRTKLSLPTQIFLVSFLLEGVWVKFKAVLSRILKAILMQHNPLAVSTRLLVSRSRFVSLIATNADFYRPISHTFRLSFYEGAV